MLFPSVNFNLKARRRSTIACVEHLQRRFLAEHQNDPNLRSWLFSANTQSTAVKPINLDPAQVAPNTGDFLEQAVRWKGSKRYQTERAELTAFYLDGRLEGYYPLIWYHLVKTFEYSHPLPQVPMDDIAMAAALSFYTDSSAECPADPTDPTKMTLRNPGCARSGNRDVRMGMGTRTGTEGAKERE